MSFWIRVEYHGSARFGFGYWVLGECGGCCSCGCLDFGGIEEATISKISDDGLLWYVGVDGSRDWYWKENTSFVPAFIKNTSAEARAIDVASRKGIAALEQDAISCLV
jgi:hypothetical protein